MALDKPYLDIPGTIIFDAEQSRKGYHLNQFCMSLMKAENRARFKANERAYLDEWPMTDGREIEERMIELRRQYKGAPGRDDLRQELERHRPELEQHWRDRTAVRRLRGTGLSFGLLLGLLGAAYAGLRFQRTRGCAGH